MLPSQKTLALNLQPQTKNGYECLSRAQKENITDCFQENLECHLQINKLTAPPSILSSWEVIAISALGGVVGGMVLANQLNR